MTKFIQTLLILLISSNLFSQEIKRIYYNPDWKVCEKEDAKYYRIVKIDNDGKSVGKVRDYYIKNNQLQWQGKMNYIDSIDNAKDSIFGICKWYHENGKVSKVIDIEKGKPSPSTYIDCDEYGACQKVFFEYFQDNKNRWLLENVDDKDYKYRSKIIPNQGLLMTNKSKHGYVEFINSELVSEANFSIETVISFKGGSRSHGHGLIWGFKDWSNYYYFLINASQQYTIGAWIEGMHVIYKDWDDSYSINYGKNNNQLKIVKVDKQIHYLVNGDLIFSNNFHQLRSSNVGFIIGWQKRELLFKELLIKQDVKNTFD